MAVINAPGSVHNSTLAHWGDVYIKLQAIYERTGGVCCVDSAFLAGEDVPCVIKSSEDLTKAKTPFEMTQMREATSLRQAAEWGMRAIQGAFPRLKDRLQFEENGERKVHLTTVPHLYNYRLDRYFPR